MKNHEKYNLWANQVHPPCGGNDAHDFQPYLVPYLLPGDQNRGAIIVCPGGAYRSHTSFEQADIALRFNEYGFHSFVLFYRLAPYKYPQPQEDALRAIKLIRSQSSELHVISDQIGIIGFSAGGHLAASISNLYNDVEICSNDNDKADGFSCRPDATLLCYPVISMMDTVGHKESTTNLLGENPTKERVWKLSVENIVAPSKTPPTFIFVTAEDDLVPPENSTLYAASLMRAGVPVALHVYPHGVHGVGLANDDPQLKEWTSLARSFLVNTCKFTAVV